MQGLVRLYSAPWEHFESRACSIPPAAASAECNFREQQEGGFTPTSWSIGGGQGSPYPCRDRALWDAPPDLEGIGSVIVEKTLCSINDGQRVDTIAFDPQGLPQAGKTRRGEFTLHLGQRVTGQDQAGWPPPVGS